MEQPGNAEYRGSAERRRIRLRWAQALLLIVGAFASSAAAADGEFFDDFVSPVSNPVNFEDPRARSEVRAIYLYHKLASDFGREIDPGGIGGDAHVVALQIRAAITDRLALIATKDGYVWLRPDNVLEDEDGWANIAFGAKYNFYKDAKLGALGSVGLRYEAPSGNTDVFQGQHPALGETKSRGEGVLNPFFSAGWGTDELGPGDLHVMTYTAMRWAIDGYDSSFFDWSLHADYGVDLGRFGKIFPLIETNLVTTTDGGRRLPISHEGFDFFNFGSSGATDHTVMTIAYGFRYRLFEDLGSVMGKGLGADLGATYENTLTDRRDIFNWRVTTDLTFFLS